MVLEITGDSVPSEGIARRAVFSEQGGVLGRNETCDWVLPDPHVSGRHARILAVGRTFFITDTDSGNGLKVNGTRLHPRELYPLEDGDRLFMDPFDIIVRIERSA